MSPSDLVWNRAAMERGGTSPLLGDVHLAALRRAHGLTCNGGVLHAIELLDSDQFDAALEGYRYFSLAPVCDLLLTARKLFDSGAIMDCHEAIFDNKYWALVPSDETLGLRFEADFENCPGAYAPLVPLSGHSATEVGDIWGQ